MTVFVDTSAYWAAMNESEVEHLRARAVLTSEDDKVTTDYVLIELWRLVMRRLGVQQADRAVGLLLNGPTHVEPVGIADLQTALQIGSDFTDQDFPLVDRTSFAVMNRLGVSTVATFDHHFAVYRFGPGRRRAFEIAR